METNNPAQPENVAPQPQEDNHLEEVLSMEGYDKPVRNARIILYVIAGLNLTQLFVLKNYTSLDNVLTIIVVLLFSGIFVALAFWTKRKSYNAIMTALIVYTTIILIGAINDPASIFQGLILKIVVYVLLIVALKNAKEVQRWKDSLKE
ncbi:hypothetical protein [Foetidibacter luteolus]|uniref:hypothetical protein n=1 Tax=Foetidibacter luteolus TaxID=2608880 RepID=UPI00129AD5B9|nr:hypothetical protein [Foetidibacter luteolus]